MRSNLFMLKGETKFELTVSPAPDIVETRIFSDHEFNDAVVRASLKIGEYSQNPNIKEAYVILKRRVDDASPAGRLVVSWTKDKPHDDICLGLLHTE